MGFWIKCEEKTDQFADSVVEERPPDLKKPGLYQVILHNDDYSTMDFVVDILRLFFNKSGDVATQIMLKIHQEGFAVCGQYPYEIAETKVLQVTEYSKGHGFPLKCTLEPAS